MTSLFFIIADTLYKQKFKRQYSLLKRKLNIIIRKKKNDSISTVKHIGDEFFSIILINNNEIKKEINKIYAKNYEL